MEKHKNDQILQENLTDNLIVILNVNSVNEIYVCDVTKKILLMLRIVHGVLLCVVQFNLQKKVPYVLCILCVVLRFNINYFI